MSTSEPAATLTSTRTSASLSGGNKGDSKITSRNAEPENIERIPNQTPSPLQQEGRRKYLPRELRIKLYNEVKKLRRDGLTYKNASDNTEEYIAYEYLRNP
jgi:hypothetical protein